MITVRIGFEERQCPIDPNWVNQQIKGRRDAGGTPCVRVTIRSSGVDVALASTGCGGGSGSGDGRAPTQQERDIFALWSKHRLDQEDFSGGELVAFLRRVGCS